MTDSQSQLSSQTLQVMEEMNLEIEMKSGADKIWNYIRNATISFPKELPHLYDTILVLQGDGFSAGTLRQIHYVQGQALSTMTEKIEIMDEQNKRLVFTVTDGDLLKYYNTFNADILVFPNGGGDGCRVTYSIKFEKATEDSPDTLIKDLILHIFHKLDDAAAAAAA